MPFYHDLPLFFSNLSDKAQILGCDVGQKRIGFSVGNKKDRIAFPLQTLFRKKLKNDVQIIQKLIHDHQIEAMVVGWPLNMDGSVGPKCQSVKDLMITLCEEYDLVTHLKSPMPILFHDERLSTFEAHDKIQDRGFSLEKKKQIIDQLAAKLILQSALDLDGKS